MSIKWTAKHFYGLGAASLLVASIFSVGYHHFDEHFQILEFAGLKLGLIEASNLPWEYHYQMRPSLQPALVVAVHTIFGWFGSNNPFHITLFLRILSAGVSFLSMWCLYRVFKDKLGDAMLRRWFMILSFLLWFVIYNGVRFSSENWSGCFFVLGFSSYFLFGKKNLVVCFITGILLGLSFLLRYQASLLIAGFALWLIFIGREHFTRLLLISLGIAVMFLSGILIDRWYYGEWTITVWNYFEQNILHDKVSGFGVHPWWWYFWKTVIIGIPPFNLLFVAALIANVLFRPKSPVIWSLVPFIILHSMIGHKEIRFLFPALLFMPVLAIQGIEILQERFYPRLSKHRYMQVFMKLFFIANFILLGIVCFKPADKQIPLYRKIYTKYNEPLTLYCISKNPYNRVIDIHYYRRQNLQIEELGSMDEIPATGKGLVILTHLPQTGHPRLGERIYTAWPEWVLKYNFNNWQSRVSTWYLFELKNTVEDKGQQTHENESMN